MTHTHDLTVAGSLLTKRYRSWHRGEHLREWAVLQHVHHHVPDLVPQPIAAELDARPPVITMSLVPGDPLCGSLTAAQLDALADAVATLWNVPHEDAPSLEAWSDDLDFARRLTAGPRPANGVTAAAFDAAQDWWNGPDPDLLQRRPPTTVLGHRDPHLPNYLWDGRRVRIVDFEDSAVSDPATELAIMLEHLSLRAVDPDELCARLNVDQQRLRAARRLWAMFWLHLLLPGGPAARRNPAGTADRQAQRLLDLLGS
jgi:aminoglycoside phosphotransferase (APT) family kinase protein